MIQVGELVGGPPTVQPRKPCFAWARSVLSAKSKWVPSQLVSRGYGSPACQATRQTDSGQFLMLLDTCGEPKVIPLAAVHDRSDFVTVAESPPGNAAHATQATSGLLAAHYPHVNSTTA